MASKVFNIFLFIIYLLVLVFNPPESDGVYIAATLTVGCLGILAAVSLRSLIIDMRPSPYKKTVLQLYMVKGTFNGEEDTVWEHDRTLAIDMATRAVVEKLATDVTVTDTRTGKVVYRG